MTQGIRAFVIYLGYDYTAKYCDYIQVIIFSAGSQKALLGSVVK